MYRKILVPLNGTKHAEVVLPHVAEIANGREVDIILVRVAIPPEANLVTEDPDCTLYTHPETEAKCSDYLKPIAAHLREHTPQVEICVRSGLPAEVILNVAREIQADMLVISKRKIHSALHSLHGCVAEKILRQAHIPVLLIDATDRMAGG